MTLNEALAQSSADRFAVLILDNEVTVSAFVSSPPLPWSRLTERDGAYRIADGYPNLLTAEQARADMKNWDRVSLPGIMRELQSLQSAVGYVLIGNNAGQARPLARSLPKGLAASRAAIIYGESLPEMKEYEGMGYRIFFRRNEAVLRLLELAAQAGRPPALFFINTIQHNQFNYHDP